MLIGQKPKNLKKKALELFERVGISEDLAKKFPSQLSGGEAQRGAFVRALINDPDVVFADEPTGALNSAGVKAVLDVLTDINESGQTVLMVTHSVKAASHASRVMFIKDGVIFHQIYRGDATDQQMYQKIRDTLNLLAQGGEQ